MTRTTTVGAGAGFAGDRVEPAVLMARSGAVQNVVLECLGERTLVPGLFARRGNPEAGFDRRLRRRLRPLLPALREHGCRVITNLGSANPAAAARAIARLASEMGLSGLRVAAVVGDDVMRLRQSVDWSRATDAEWLGAHAYLGVEGIRTAIEAGADVIVTGRAADSALFAAPCALDDDQDAFAGATVMGHLLECTGHLTGGNYEDVAGQSLSARAMADLGYPVARVSSDGTTELFLLDGAPGLIDRYTCTLQLLYEVHDPSAYYVPDAIVDFSTVRFAESGPNRVRVSGARYRGRPTHLKVSGFVIEPGAIADVEIAYAGLGALARARCAAEVLALRMEQVGLRDVQIDLVGVNSVLGAATRPPRCDPTEVRVHVSARSDDREAVDAVEDEVYALTLDGPAGGSSVRSERRERVEIIDGLIPRELVGVAVEWEISR